MWLARPLWVIAEFIQRFPSSIGDERKVIPDPNAKYFGAVLDKDGLALTGANSLLDRHALPIGHAPNAEAPHQKESHREEDRFAAACRRLTAIDKCGSAGDECGGVEGNENL